MGDGSQLSEGQVDTDTQLLFFIVPKRYIRFRAIHLGRTVKLLHLAPTS